MRLVFETFDLIVIDALCISSVCTELGGGDLTRVHDVFDGATQRLEHIRRRVANADTVEELDKGRVLLSVDLMQHYTAPVR